MSSKQIYDPIHKFITVTPLMTQIIDTYEFQRLRDLKQLGATYLVFPSASHNRFEHSIGVSHLAGIMMDELYLKQPDMIHYKLFIKNLEHYMIHLRNLKNTF